MAINKKLELSKKDMNFFSEFSSTSSQAGSYLSLAIVLLLGFIVIGGAVYGVISFQTSAIQNDINALNVKMESDSYQAELAKYSDIQSSLSELNQQFYDVSSLYAKVSTLDKAETKYMDLIYSNLPSDIVISKVDFTNGTIILEGRAESYYSPLDMINNFNKAKIFSYVGITKIEQTDVSQQTLTPEEQLTAVKYRFQIQGSLKSSYAVIISRLIDDTKATPLTAVKSQKIDVGTQYTESGINTYTLEDGSTYTLSRVMINNASITDAQMTAIRASDTISGIVSGAVDVKLFYILSSDNGGVQG